MNKTFKQQFLSLALATATALYGQTAGGPNGSSDWPKWPVIKNQDPAPKPPTAPRPPQPVPPEQKSDRSATDLPKDLFQPELDRAMAARRRWFDVHSQIPKTITGNRTAAQYAELIRRITLAGDLKRIELAAFHAYHQKSLTHWANRRDEESASDIAVKAEIGRIEQLLAQAEKELADVQQRLLDVSQREAAADDSSELIRANLARIQEQLEARIRKLRRAIEAEQAAIGNQEKMRIIASANIALIQNNLATNSLEGIYWPAVYGSLHSMVRLFQDQVTPPPPVQPTGEEQL